MTLTQQAKEFYAPGADVTAIVTAPVVRERFVKITATRAKGENIRVAHCGAGEAAIGVARFDAPVIGDLVGVRFVGAGSVIGVTAGAAITAGQEVQSDANGQAIPLAAGKSLGIAVATAAVNETAQIALGR